jgi:hypothetical protein
VRQCVSMTNQTYCKRWGIKCTRNIWYCKRWAHKCIIR